MFEPNDYKLSDAQIADRLSAEMLVRMTQIDWKAQWERRKKALSALADEVERRLGVGII